jgi:hypothetical protein
MCFPLVHRADLEGAPKGRRQTIIPFDRDTPWSTHGALVVSTRSKPSSSKRLPSRCEKTGQADDVLRAFALKPYRKQGERDDRKR